MSRFYTFLIYATMGLPLAYIGLGPQAYWRNVTGHAAMGRETYDVLGKQQFIVNRRPMGFNLTLKRDGVLVTDSVTELMRPPGILVTRREPTQQEIAVWTRQFGER